MELKLLIEELQASGLNQTEISRLTPCAQSTISGILSGERGARPGYDLTIKLHALHAERCKPEHADKAAA